MPQEGAFTERLFAFRVAPLPLLRDGSPHMVQNAVRVHPLDMDDPKSGVLNAGARPRPSAVLWDLGGVLVRMDWNSASVYWEPRLGLQEGDLLRCLFGGNDDTVLVGRVAEDEWWQVVAQRIGTSSREVQALRTDLCRREAFDYELLQIVRDLRGIAKQAVVSNAWGSTRERLRTMEVDELFDEIVISAEVGVAKPAAKIFQIAWDRLRLSPTDCAFIDDTLENVEAAAALGMHSYLHQSSRRTAAWLRARFGTH